MSDPISGVLGCLNAKISIPFPLPPSIDQPGLPTIIAGFVGASLAGIKYTLDYLPLDPNNLPSLPTIDLFISGFTGAALGLPTMPSFAFTMPDIPGLPSIPPFTIPAIPGHTILPPGFDPSAMIKLFAMFIATPFLIFEQLIQSIIHLNPVITDLPV